MALRNPKLETFGNLHKINDMSGGMYTVRPQDMIPENASPYTRCVLHDRHHCLSKIWGSAELLTLGGTAQTNYNQFLNSSDYVYALYPYITPAGQTKLIIQGKDDDSDGYMSLYALDVQDSYPAAVEPTRILGATAGDLADKRRCTFATYKGRLYTWNGADYLRRWNGADWRNYHTTEDERFKYITTYGRRLWAASSGKNPSRVIYTDLNKCHFSDYFNSEQNYIDFNSPVDYSPIMWITQFKNRLLIFKQNSIYAFYGDPDTHGINFDIVAHNIGTISGWSVQVHNDRVYFAGKDGIYVYGDYNIIASAEDRKVSTEPNVIRISSEIDNWWEDQFTLPDMNKTIEVSKSGYEDFCSTLAFTAGGDASNFKADDIGIEANDYIVGATSGAVARVAYVDKTSGTWTGGDAAGTLYLTEVYARLDFDHGGTNPIEHGYIITGATSDATAYVYKVRVTSGTWVGGDAAGYLLVQLADESEAAFTDDEHLNVDIQSDIADVDGTLTTWTATEKINIGSKEYATAGTFTQGFKTWFSRLNVAPNSENQAVFNADLNDEDVPHTSEQSNTATPENWVDLRGKNGKDAYFSQSFKLSNSVVDYAICSGVQIHLKEIGDVSGDTLKVYICGETDGEPDFDKLYAEGSVTGVFLNDLEYIKFDSGSVEPCIGDTIEENGGDASAVLHKIVITSGEWNDGDAAGYFYIKGTSGTWTDNDQIDINGGTANIATVDGTKADIDTGMMVFVDMNYWDYPQTMYKPGGLTAPPQLYLTVKATGDDDANYLQWGYGDNDPADLYADGQMVNSDTQTPASQSTLDYAFNIYCRAFRYRGYTIVETDTFDGTSSHSYWQSLNITLNDDGIGDYERKYKLEKVEYLTKSSDSGWTDWSSASETTNGGAIGDATNASTNRYVRFRLSFSRPYGSAAAVMDSYTIENIKASCTKEDIYNSLVSSAIWEDRYIFSLKSIADPEAAPS